MTERAPNAPAGLTVRGRGRRLWREMHAEFDFSTDPHRLILLEDLCRTVDLIDRLQEKIDELGDDIRVTGSMKQPVSAPEFAEIRSQRTVAASLIKALAIPETPAVAAAQSDHATAKRLPAGPGDKQLRIVGAS